MRATPPLEARVSEPFDVRTVADALDVWPTDDLTDKLVVIQSPHLSPNGANVCGASSPSDAAVNVVIACEQDLQQRTLDVTITKGSHHGGYTLSLRFQWLPNAAPTVTTTIECERDAGPPFGGTWSKVNGRITINSFEVESREPRVIEYSLYGVMFGQTQCLHGKVVTN